MSPHDEHRIAQRVISGREAQEVEPARDSPPSRVVAGPRDVMLTAAEPANSECTSRAAASNTSSDTVPSTGRVNRTPARPDIGLGDAERVGG